MRFNDMPISDGSKDAVAAMGYEETTPIQGETIPLLLEGDDVIGQARTGTGKTAAFGIPMVEALRDTRDTGVVGLVLAPTRELALQVHEVLRDLARGSKIQVATAYGGTGFEKQIRALQKRTPTILVACPGRLLDLVQRGHADLRLVKVLVLDEADRMLDMGFVHDVRRIINLTPKGRQTSLFSATIDKRIQNLARDFMHDPHTVRVEGGPTATTLTEQFHVRVEKQHKQDTLLTLLHGEQPDKAVVFTRTKHLAKRMAQRLGRHGWASVALQGNMTQNQRERAMDAFREGDARILVATDVAARGLDVPDITHVINFDLPQEPESYVHRIGRTGRNGREGRSFTFVQSDQHGDFRTIQGLAGTQIPKHIVEVQGQAPKGPDPDRPTLGRPQGGNGGQHRNGDHRGRSRGNNGSRGPHRNGKQGGRRGSNNGPRRGGQHRSHKTHTK